MRSAVVAGATGLVGRELLTQLLSDDRYDRISVVSRRSTAIKHDKLREYIVDFDRLGESSNDIAGEDVYCCLGTTIKKAGSQENFRRVDLDYVRALATVMRERGARRFMLVSAVDANTDSKVFYSRIKGLAEQAVEELAFEQSYAVRPSLLTGTRDEYRLAERLTIPLAKLVSPLLIGAVRKYRAVAASRVAEILRECAASDRPGHHVQHCAGG